MKTAQLGDIFEWNGQIVKCEWINPGEKSIGFKIKSEITCPHCKTELELFQAIDVIESSPAFQEGAKAVKTISE